MCSDVRTSEHSGRGSAQTATCDLEGAHYENPCRALWKDQSGATAIEYSLIAAGIAVAIIGVVQGLGTKLKSTFKSVSDNLK